MEKFHRIFRVQEAQLKYREPTKINVSVIKEPTTNITYLAHPDCIGVGHFIFICILSTDRVSNCQRSTIKL